MNEQVLPDEVWERATAQQGRSMVVLPDGSTQFRDGDWRLSYTGPTVGDGWQVFDGWWKEEP